MASKPNIVERIVMGDPDKPDLEPGAVSASKWTLFKETFMGRFGSMVITNLLTAIFFLPGIVVAIYFYTLKASIGSLLPYSGNFGIGYPLVTGVAAMGASAVFWYNIVMYAILVPCIMIGALGLAGNFYVMRKFAWGESVQVAKDFFRGLARNWLSFIVLGLLVGLTILLFVFNLGYYDVMGYSVGVKATAVTLSAILLVVVSIVAMFWMTQTVAYKMRPMVLVRNSILLSFGTLIPTLAILVVSVGPMFLGFIPGITMLIAILYLFIGVSYGTCAITMYTHSCYAKYMPDERKTTVYKKRQSEVEELRDKQTEKQTEKRPEQKRYVNPKKKKKRSIDEGKSITPLAPTFNRADLERLEKEHKEVLSENKQDDDECELDEELDDENVTLDSASEVSENENVSEQVADTEQESESTDDENA